MRRAEARTGGFTLLELLIAITMLVIVLTTLYGSYRGFLTRNPWIEKDFQAQEMGRICLNQMLSDLKSIYVVPFREYKAPQPLDPPGPYRVIAENISAGGRSFPRLAFPSFYWMRLEDGRRQDIARIVYYVQPSPQGAWMIKRAESVYPYPPFKENPADPVLCRQVRSIHYTFFDGNGKEYQTWDSDSREWDRQTPAAVQIRLELEAGENRTLKMETSLYFPDSRTREKRKS